MRVRSISGNEKEGLGTGYISVYSRFTMADRDVNLMESPPDKAVLVGDVGVGKTSLFVRFKTGEFSDNVSHNPREGEYQKKWDIDGKQVSVCKAS